MTCFDAILQSAISAPIPPSLAAASSGVEPVAGRGRGCIDEQDATRREQVQGGSRHEASLLLIELLN